MRPEAENCKMCFKLQEMASSAQGLPVQPSCGCQAPSPHPSPRGELLGGRCRGGRRQRSSCTHTLLRASALEQSTCTVVQAEAGAGAGMGGERSGLAGVVVQVGWWEKLVPPGQPSPPPPGGVVCAARSE
eukprot:1977169-Rhodomonas_salina.2